MPVIKSYSRVSVRESQGQKKKTATAKAGAKKAAAAKSIYDVKGPARKSPFERG